MTAVRIPLSPGAAVPRDLREWSTWATNAAAQNVRAGATGYRKGNGIWFGRDTDGVNKIFVGDENGNLLAYDGTTLTVIGNITLQAGAVGEDELADGAVTEDKIGDAAVSEGKLTANAVTADKIAADAVTAVKIAADAVTADKIDVTDLSAVSASILGALSIGTSGSLGSGQTAYNTGTGFWLEYNAGTPRFSIGNSAGNRVTWDGSSLSIIGTLTGSSVSNLGNLSANLGTITAASVTLGSSGYVKQGQTAYDTGTGFWLGDVSGTPKFSIGNASGDKLTWDGSSLTIKPTVGSFTPGWFGFSSNPSGDVSYIDFGSFVILWPQGAIFTGTSNSVSMAMTGLPAAIRPNTSVLINTLVFDDDVPFSLGPGGSAGRADISTGGTVFFSLLVVDSPSAGGKLRYDASAFANSGDKGWMGVLIYPKG